MMHRFDHVLLLSVVLVVLSIAAAALAFAASFAGWLAPPPIVYQLPNKVEPSVVHPGDPISVTLKQCVQDGINGSVYYTIDRTLVEREDRAPRRELFQERHSVPEGCTETTSSFNRVPANMKPGVWHIESVVVAYGAHGPKLVRTVSEWFTVLGNGESPQQPEPEASE